MRLFILSIVLCSFFLNISAQVNNLSGRNISKADELRILKQSFAKSASPFHANKKMQRKNVLPISVLKNPERLSAFIKSKNINGIPVANNLSSTVKKNNILSADNCADTSFDELINIHYNAVYIDAISHTSDDGVLMCGLTFDNTFPDGEWQQKGIIIKADNKGNVIWMKLFADQNNDKFYSVEFRIAQELQNGDILAVGETGIFDNTGNNYYILPIFRLNPQGNVVWNSFLQSNLTHPDNIYSVDFKNISEGNDGGIILSGSTFDDAGDSSFATIAKISPDGNKLWDVSFGGINRNSYGTEGYNAYIENGTVRVPVICDGTLSYDDIGFITLDYMSGNVLDKIFYKTPLAINAPSTLNNEFLPHSTSSTKLNNGHYLFYGTLFSDELQNTTPINHYAVAEFDQDMKPVNTGYMLSSFLPTTSGEDFIQFNNNGKGIFVLFHNNNGGSYYENLYIGSLINYQIAKLRVAIYNNVGLAEEGGYLGQLFSFMNDGGYVLGQSYFGNGLYSNSNVEFRYMHDSDTASVCLGKDTAFVFKTPYAVTADSNFNFLDTPYKNNLTPTQYHVTVLDTLKFDYSNPCQQQSQCDTLKIHGQSVFCGSQQQVKYTAYKNLLCGSNVLWNIDPSIADTIIYTNDTTVTISFKNMNWQGYLYASLSTGSSCTLPVRDSMYLHITGTSDSVNLGNDTVVCSNKFLTLHAGNEFSSYLWQDGSTDSTYQVKQSGIYSVTTTDFCANRYTDSITVNFTNYILSIGNDTSVCNTDTLKLTASPGFISYQWSPAYNISVDTGASVSVFPLVDTAYTVIAQKFSGCYSYDTIDIKMLYSTPIHLGNDTSFCFGDSIVLHAGTAFNSYLWSNGETDSSISIQKAGSYSVIATSVNQCKSFDTFQVLQIFPKPFINIQYDSILCSGSSETLTPGNSYMSYLWQDGSTGNSITVSSTGTYWLQVADAKGCTANDTILISSIAAHPFGFLPNDTTICNYTPLFIQPLHQYTTYSWNTGETTPSISIKDSGIYILQVTDEHGCSGTDSISISIKQCLSGAYFPDAFTPNNDGHNDFYKPILLGNIVKYHFSIYNRYGQLVFDSGQPGKGWDGTLQGKLQNNGTYVWYCKYQFTGEAEKSEKGFVLLIK